MKRRESLLIPNGIAPAKPDITLDVHPKSDDEINDDRTAERKKTEVYEIEPDFRTGYIEFFTQVGANAKHIVFYKTSQSFHQKQFFQKQISVF
jgi:hypothetical protein